MPTTSVIFFGNTRYSAIVERALFERFGLVAVVTIPDRADKDKRAVSSPVKDFAQAHSMRVIEADTLTKEVVNKLGSLNADFFVVADYGLILPKAVLKVPRTAALNVHHSLLPKYRGPAPAPAAILAGDAVSGVSIIAMNERVDAGDILAQTEYPLEADETTETLLTKLNELGAAAIVETIERYDEAAARAKKQDEAKATFTHMMKREDGRIELSGSPEENWRKFRAYGDWPGTFFITKHGDKDIMVKVAKARFENGTFVVERVIPAGKREMGYEDFLRGLR